MAENYFFLFNQGLSASFRGGAGENRTLLFTPEIRRSLIFRNYILENCLGLSEVIILLFQNSY